MISLSVCCVCSSLCYGMTSWYFLISSAHIQIISCLAFVWNICSITFMQTFLLRTRAITSMQPPCRLSRLGRIGPTQTSSCLPHTLVWVGDREIRCTSGWKRCVSPTFIGAYLIWFKQTQCKAKQCNVMHFHALQCNAMQNNALQCDAAQCAAMHSNEQHYATMQCNTMQWCNETQCNAMQCKPTWCDAMHCNATQCNTIQRNAM